MNYQKVGESIVLRLAIGEEVCECLLRLAEAEDIRLAEISGLGASITAQVGIFDPAAKTYSPVRAENEFLEAVSLTGSLTRKDGKPYLHMHALLANPATAR
jgi:predicted DNA-binding protein with PD1-like motif